MEETPEMNKWIPKPGNRVKLRENISSDIVRALEPHIEKGETYTVIKVVPADDDGPMVLFLGRDGISEEELADHESESLGVAVDHLESI